MARPAKWKSSTTAIRVPEHLADALVEIARSLEADIPSAQADSEIEAYLSFVQNSSKPKLLTVQDFEDGFKEHSYVIQADPVSFNEWKQLRQISERVQREILEGLSSDERLYFFSRLAQEVFPEHQMEELGGRA